MKERQKPFWLGEYVTILADRNDPDTYYGVYIFNSNTEAETFGVKAEAQDDYIKAVVRQLWRLPA